jgi:hypothetical protein
MRKFLLYNTEFWVTNVYGKGSSICPQRVLNVFRGPGFLAISTHYSLISIFPISPHALPACKLYLFVQVEEWIPVQDIALLKSAEWAQG